MPPVSRTTSRSRFALARSASELRARRRARTSFQETLFRLEEPLPVDELAAGEPREGTAFEDLKMHGRRIVLRMIFAVLGDPGADRLVGAHARNALAVEEDGVTHQPPAVAYATTPLAPSAAWAAASRATGTR